MSGRNEWTLMFVFAGDNMLSPSMVSQLKALKDAGFQENTTVLVYFDPSERGAPTRLFEVNRKRKEKFKTRIGDGNDPFVRNLIEDEITEQLLAVSNGEAAKALRKELGRPDRMRASQALSTFLDFSLEHHSAQHYMLFLVGHGMIVGNDAFLPDDHPVSGISLKQLGTILGTFADKVKGEQSTFELLGLHSCSMSGVEVAYELKNTAKFMMATEGISFVGSWPYRQLLKGLFNTINKAKKAQAEVDIKQMLRKLYYCSLHNSTDYMFAGLSADLALLNLDETKVNTLNVPLQELTRALKDALGKNDDYHRREQERILLAHWKSQSYWEENYTDLYDLCACLSKMYDAKSESENPIYVACQKVMRTLDAAQRADMFDAFIVYSDHFGPTYQYSHGVSIYFPWSRPIPDGTKDVMKVYQGYAFNKELGKDSWLSFLKGYFEKTKRETREKEDGDMIGQTHRNRIELVNNKVFLKVGGNGVGVLDGALEKANPAESGGKPNPADSGGVCTCVSIKNYPMEFSLSQRASEAIKLNGR